MIKKNIYILYAIALLQGMVFYGPIATLYRQANGLSIFQITLIESISYLLCILFEVPWGIVADRIGYKKTMCFCCSLYFISKLVFWKATCFSSFLLERVMLSMVIAGMSGVDTSMLYLSCRRGESQKAFGIYNSLSICGMLFASLVFSVFIQDNYSAAALLTVFSYALAAILSLFLTEVKAPEAHTFHFCEFRAIFGRIIRNKRLILFLVAVAFMSQTHQSVTVFLNQLQYAKCGLSSANIGYIYIGITLAGLSGAFSHRFTRKVGVQYAGIIFYTIGIVACFALSVTNSAIISVLGILFLNITGSFFQPLQLEQQNQQVLTENRATELSIYAIIIDGISAGTSVLFGALAKLNLKPAFIFGMGLCCIGLLLYVFWFKSRQAESIS